MRKAINIRVVLLIVAAVVIIGGSIAYYIFNAPQRNVQAAKTDYSYNASDIVNEYLLDATKANAKYLDEEGDSKILEITGTVDKISEDFNKQKVILLKSKNDKAGVSCTFLSEATPGINNIQIGQTLLVKGVIRSGASFDADMNLYEDVIMEKCDILIN